MHVRIMTPSSGSSGKTLGYELVTYTPPHEVNFILIHGGRTGSTRVRNMWASKSMFVVGAMFGELQMGSEGGVG